MKNITILSLLAITLSASSLIHAAESVDRNLTLGTATKIDIKVQQGNVNIVTWDKSEVNVSGMLDELSEGLIFEVQSNDLVIEDKLPQRYSSQNNQGSTLTISIPEHIDLIANSISANYQLANLKGQVQINSVSGDLTLDKLEGKQVYKTVSGDIHSQQLVGDIRLTTVSGKIIDSDSQGSIHYTLVSGDLNGTSQAQEVNIETVSGDSHVKLLQATQVELKSISGDSEMLLAAKFNSINAESVSGDIVLTFADMPSARVDIDGGPGGKIRNNLTPDAPQKAQHAPNSTLVFQAGAAEGTIKLSTISGSLTLDKD